MQASSPGPQSTGPVCSRGSPPGRGAGAGYSAWSRPLGRLRAPAPAEHPGEDGDPDKDTEWNDILRKKGILPPKEDLEEQERAKEEEQLAILQKSLVKTYEDVTLEELEENEDEFNEEDEKAIEMYRET